MRTLRAVQMMVAAMLCTASIASAEVVVQDWAEALNREIYHGQTTLATQGGMADILTEREAVVIATVGDAPAKTIELANVVKATGRRGILVVVLATGDDLTKLGEIEAQAKNANLRVEVAQTLIDSAPNGYIHPVKAKKVSTVSIVAATPTASTPAPPASAATSTNATTTSAASTTTKIAATSADASEMSYWLNTKTGKRHNKGCRYYGKGKNGRPCGPNEGHACGICGG